MNTNANWIWTAEDDKGRNLIVCARRVFTLSERLSEAWLEISADNRYVLYVNGERVGQGPAKSWNRLMQYDRYEVGRYLQAGANVIAVQVSRWGVANSHCEGGPGGLIAGLSAGNAGIVTDDSWKIAVHPGYHRRVPRMFVITGFSESYDAQYGWDQWIEPDFDDSDWSAPIVLGPFGTAPWTDMQARTIPLLTEQPMYPVRVFDTSAVQPPRYSYAFDLYDALREPHGVDNPCTVGVMVGKLLSDRDCDVTMVRMNQSSDIDTFGGMRVNGQDTRFVGDRTTFGIKKGSNLIVIRFPHEGQSYPSWVFESDGEISLHTPIGDPAGPVAVYPCRSLDDPVVTSCWHASALSDLAECFPKLRAIRPEERYADVFALSNMRKVIQDCPVRIRNSQAICSGNSEYAEVLPAVDSDIEFLLDFGEETVGFIEFELDAPAGTIVDFNCFEAIVDGYWSWTDNLRNTLRYVSRDSWQKFHSVVRRGFRYAQVTIRGASRAVKIKEILCQRNTYPVQEQGEFNCSDALLNAAWTTGRRTVRMCMDDTFVDCPAYEQNFWIGDARNEVLSAYAAFGDTDLAERCWRFASESLWRSPMPEALTPITDPKLLGMNWIIPNWSMLWVLGCEEFYRYTGNREFVADIIPYVLRTCDFMLSRRNHLGLWQHPAWNLLDWAAMDCPSDGTITNENALLVETLRRTASLADVVGDTVRSSNLLDDADRLAQAVNDHLWSEEHDAFVDSIHGDGSPSPVFSQQTQTMAYLCGCVSDDRLDKVGRYLTDVPEGWVQVGSPWMLWFTLEALAKKGDHRGILALIRSRWGQMLEYGATTFWETFENAFSGRWKPTRSWCHAWSSAPTYFLSTYQLGVHPLEPGYRRVMIAPEAADLSWAKGRVPTPHGVISVSWKTDDVKFDISVVLPMDVDAEIRIPVGYEPGETRIIRRSTTTASEPDR